MNKIKKVLMGIVALGALAFGGAQLAGATTSGPSSPSSSEQSEQSEAAESPGSEKGERGERSDEVTGADAEKVKAAALAEVGSGTATEVSAENDGADKAEPADKPEKGEKADPAYEAQIAYDVEVTKADGSVVDVHLDKAFTVLGTEAGDQERGADDEDGQAGD